MSDRELPAPSSFTVGHDHKPVLYTADGKALVRAAGFVPQGQQMALQSTGQFPQLNTKMTSKTGKSGKGGKKGGRRGC